MSSKYTDTRTIFDIVEEYSQDIPPIYQGMRLISPDFYPLTNIHLLNPSTILKEIKMHIASLNFSPYNHTLSTRLLKLTNITMLFYMLLEATYYQDYLEYIEATDENHKNE
jgi:hypothetical protein